MAGQHGFSRTVVALAALTGLVGITIGAGGL
jgi:hypothetical protein